MENNFDFLLSIIEKFSYKIKFFINKTIFYNNYKLGFWLLKN